MICFTGFKISIGKFTNSIFFLVVVVCANPSTVREIMLAADDLNMVSSGEYVFFNIELFSKLVYTYIKKKSFS